MSDASELRELEYLPFDTGWHIQEVQPMSSAEIQITVPADEGFEFPASPGDELKNGLQALRRLRQRLLFLPSGSKR